VPRGFLPFQSPFFLSLPKIQFSHQAQGFQSGPHRFSFTSLQVTEPFATSKLLVLNGTMTRQQNYPTINESEMPILFRFLSAVQAHRIRLTFLSRRERKKHFLNAINGKPQKITKILFKKPLRLRSPICYNKKKLKREDQEKNLIMIYTEKALLPTKEHFFEPKRTFYLTKTTSN
jgi:hypothetical protein